MKPALSWAIVIVGFGLSSCAPNASYVKNGDIKQTIDQQADQKSYIQTLGLGAADGTLTNVTQRKATARDAAIVQAQYEMLSIVKGVQLEGGITVQKAMETDSQLETNVKQTIRGASVVKTEWTNDDGCVVTLRLGKKQLADQTGLKLKS